MHMPEKRRELIDAIRALPAQLEAILTGWTDEQLDYRPAPTEWNARQIVHHLVDSHATAIFRTKKALTEDKPQIVAYDQAAFAELPDSLDLPITISMDILRGLHARWVYVFDHLKDEQFSALYFHPEYQRTYTIDDILTTYAEHGIIHIAQIEGNRASGGW